MNTPMPVTHISGGNAILIVDDLLRWKRPHNQEQLWKGKSKVRYFKSGTDISKRFEERNIGEKSNKII